jgi:hypothetical protein
VQRAEVGEWRQFHQRRDFQPTVEDQPDHGRGSRGVQQSLDGAISS